MDEADCAFLVAGMQVLSVNDITNLEEPPSQVGWCSPALLEPVMDAASARLKGNCSCAVNVTHFTTFATVDAEADNMLVQAQGDAPGLLSRMSVYCGVGICRVSEYICSCADVWACLSLLSVTCQSCPAGQYNQGCSQSEAGTCVNCPAGSSSPTGSTGQDQCKQCDANFFAESGGLCTACGSGNSPPGSESVEDCKCGEGFEVSADQARCEKCRAGTYKGATDETCTACARGKYLDYEGATSWSDCLSCPANSWSLEEGSQVRSECQCNAGYQASSDGTCEPCAAGYYKFEVGNGQCEECLSGSIAPSTGATECSECPADSYANASTSCVPCVEHASSSSGSVQCACDAGYTGDGITCQACVAGKFKASSGAAICTPCTQHSTTNAPASIASSACLCNAGYKGDHDAGCTECGAGTYKQNLGADLCDECPAHSHSPAGATSQDACACNAGYRDSSGVCVACSAGTYKESSGATECIQCAAGKFGTGGQAQASSNSCQNCPLNTWSDTQGAHSSATCTACDGNRHTRASKSRLHYAIVK